MKILIIAKSLNVADGQGRYAVELVNQLANRCQLTILTSETGGNTGDINSRAVIVKIPDLLNLRGNLINLLKYFIKFRKLLKHQDLVHFFTDLPNYLLFSPICLTRAKIPFFITAHGTFAIRLLDNKKYSWLAKKLFLKAIKIICVSRFTEHEIQTRLPAAVTCIINNGVDYNKFHPQVKKPVQVNKIISVGACKARKGYYLSLEIIKRLKENFPDIKYVIIGSQADIGYVNQLNKKISDDSLTANICLKENISDQELADIYQTAGIFLLASQSVDKNFEGFGLVFLEAAAAGLPAIGFSGSGAEDAIKDGYSGYLVGSPEEAVKKITLLLTDDNLRQQLGSQAQCWAKEHDWQVVVRQYIKLYDQMG